MNNGVPPTLGSGAVLGATGTVPPTSSTSAVPQTTTSTPVRPTTVPPTPAEAPSSQTEAHHQSARHPQRPADRLALVLPLLGCPPTGRRWRSQQRISAPPCAPPRAAAPDRCAGPRGAAVGVRGESAPLGVGEPPRRRHRGGPRGPVAAAALEDGRNPAARSKSFTAPTPSCLAIPPRATWPVAGQHSGTAGSTNGVPWRLPVVCPLL